MAGPLPSCFRPLLALLCLLATPALRAQSADAGGPADASVPAADAAVADASPPDADRGDAACGDVDALGECMGTTRRVCVGGVLSVLDCAREYGLGFTCRLTEPLFAAACVFEGQDGGQPTPDGGTPPDAGALTPDGGDRDGSPASSGCYRPATSENALVLGGAFWLWVRRRPRRTDPSANLP